MKRRGKAKKRILLGLTIFIALSLLGGGLSRYSYSYKCLICEKRWTRKTTWFWLIPIWSNFASHPASDHPPTYISGGYSHQSWFMGGAVVGCGSHGQVSGDYKKYLPALQNQASKPSPNPSSN